MDTNPEQSEVSAETPGPVPPSRTAPLRLEPGLLLSVVLLVLALTALVSVRPWQRPQVSWSNDLDGALVAARKSGRPVFVEISADWCAPCRQMERDTFSDVSVGRALADLHPVQLNGDRPEVQRRMVSWSAVGFPTHVLLKSDGSLLAVVSGYLPPDDFVNWLAQAAPTDRGRG